MQNKDISSFALKQLYSSVLPELSIDENYWMFQWREEVMLLFVHFECTWLVMDVEM